MWELPWIAIFVLFSPWWWLLVVGASCTVIWALDDDRFGFASTVVVLSLVAMTVFGGTELWYAIAANPMTVVYGIIGYFVLGTIWGIIKWYFFAVKRLEAYEEIKLKWLRDRGVEGKTIPEELKLKWMDYLTHETNYVKPVKIYDESQKKWVQKLVPQIKPLAWENKARILGWMTYWPWSLLWALLDDIVKTIFKHIQRHLGRLMDAITNMVFRRVEDDFKTADGQKTVDLIKVKDPYER